MNSTTRISPIVSPEMAIRPDTNPDALDDAPDAIVDFVRMEGAKLYYELRGSGSAVLIVGAADEDTEIYRGVADRLAMTSTVVTYDRRGTGQSGSQRWPSDSAGHADDAAILISKLGLDSVTVLGTSAGGIVALRLALRHPEKLKSVLCYEPGIFHLTEETEAFARSVESAIEEHLELHPGDWSGAVDALGHAAVSSLDEGTSLFSPPEGKQWFARRTDANAESLVRGDLPLTHERFDSDALSNCSTNLRFSHGTASLPIFGEIASLLAATQGDEPDKIDGMGHNAFYHPDAVADYVRRWL